MAPKRLLLKAHDLKQVMQRYLARLREHRDALNNLNVYPVPDGDTGTNMTLTVESVVAATDTAESMEQVAAAISEGSLMGAQGNSGIILSQILRGLADAFRSGETVGAAQLVDALDRASDAAYRAVAKPVEGTILTVLREAAEAAAEGDTPMGEDLSGFLLRIYRRAETALEGTPELLPVLRDAGVVDAGGAGFLILLAAFLEEVTGEEVDLPDVVFAGAHRAAVVEDDSHAGTVGGPRYEVMFLLRSDDPDAGDRLRSDWADAGDSIVVVGGEGVWNCHIHSDDIGGSIEMGIARGVPSVIKVTDLFDQVESLDRGAPFRPLPEFESAEVGVVAVAAGTGIIELFRDAGAQNIVVGGQTMNPSVRALLAAVEDAPANQVVILPNNKNVVPVAMEMDALTNKAVLVVPTVSVPEGIAAMYSYLPDADAAAVAAAMTEAAEACSWGEVAQAVGDATTPSGPIVKGDWLGIVDGDVSVVADDPAAAAVGVLAALIGDDSELVTVIAGEESDQGVVGEIESYLNTTHPDVDVTLLAGGQPLYPYLFGVE